MNHVSSVSSEVTFIKSSIRQAASQTRISSRQEQRYPEVSGDDRLDQSPEYLSTMKFYLFTPFFIYCFVIVSHALPINDQEGSARFLKKFGYLNEANGHGGVIGADTLSNALKDFQKFVGLRVTGKLDQDTVLKMNAPRCGVKDIINPSKSARRKRYAVHESKWEVHLTYRVSKYPVAIEDRSKVDEEIARAFKVWSNNTKVTFEERKTGRVNIDILFEAGNYSESDAFDGRGKTLAYALFPRDGGIHFNDDEEWTIDEDTGTNLFQVATHEIGHSLGLLHSDVKEAVMMPYYTGYNSSFELHNDDIQAIQSLYGTNQLSRPEDEPPDLCEDAKIDAITRTDNGTTYVFKGNFYWKVHSEGGIAKGFPRRISDDWDGLEGNLDASFTWLNEKTYFFKGGRCWRFTGQNMDPGYPRSLSVVFEGIPDDLDAAFVWNANRSPYFFKGAQYWRYDIGGTPPVITSKFPAPISEWKGVPNNIDAVVRWANSKTYFFKGDKYYKYDDVHYTVETQPSLTSVGWFGC